MRHLRHLYSRKKTCELNYHLYFRSRMSGGSLAHGKNEREKSIAAGPVLSKEAGLVPCCGWPLRLLLLLLLLLVALLTTLKKHKPHFQSHPEASHTNRTFSQQTVPSTYVYRMQYLLHHKPWHVFSASAFKSPANDDPHSTFDPTGT